MRFDRAAEFLAACASGDTEEAQMMLLEAKETKRRNGEDVGEIINCSNADGITALHQVRLLPSSRCSTGVSDQAERSDRPQPLRCFAGLHRRQHGDGVLPPGAQR